MGRKCIYYRITPFYWSSKSCDQIPSQQCLLEGTFLYRQQLSEELSVQLLTKEGQTDQGPKTCIWSKVFCRETQFYALLQLSLLPGFQPEDVAFWPRVTFDQGSDFSKYIFCLWKWKSWGKFIPHFLHHFLHFHPSHLVFCCFCSSLRLSSFSPPRCLGWGVPTVTRDHHVWSHPCPSQWYGHTDEESLLSVSLQYESCQQDLPWLT